MNLRRIVGAAALLCPLLAPAQQTGDDCHLTALLAVGPGKNGVYSTLAPTVGGQMDRSRTFGSTCGWLELSGTGEHPRFRRVGGLDKPGMLLSRGRNELLVVGGLEDPADTLSAPGTPYVAGINSETFSQNWRTPLDLSGVQWWVPGGAAVHASGALYAVAGRRVFRIGANGAVESSRALLAEGTSALEGLLILPDGKLIVTVVHKPANTPQAGLAARRRGGMPAPSQLLRLDPQSLATLDSIALPEPVYGQPALGFFRTQSYVYLTGHTHLLRLGYAAGKLTLDGVWRPEYVRRTQRPGYGPVVMGDWVVATNNALPASEPMSVVVVPQVDGRRVTGLRPLLEVENSYAPIGLAADPINRRIYVTDQANGRLAALVLDIRKGELEILWKAEQVTVGAPTLLGSELQRMVLTAARPTEQGAGSTVQQLVWRSAVDGEELGRSATMDAGGAVGPLPGFRATFLTLCPARSELIEFRFVEEGPKQPKPAKGKGR